MICGIMANQGVASACAYPLDATNEDAIALGATGAMVASNAGKTATYTIQSGLPADLAGSGNYLQFNTPFPTTVDLSTGKKVIEFVVNAPAGLAGGVGNAIIGLSLSDSLGASFVMAAFVDLLPDGSKTLTLRNSALATKVIPGVVYPATVGLRFDSVAGTFTAKINGTDIDLVTDGFGTYAPQEVVLALLSSESLAPDAVAIADAGKELSITLHASAGDITQTYAAGTTDICGTPL